MGKTTTEKPKKATAHYPKSAFDPSNARIASKIQFVKVVREICESEKVALKEIFDAPEERSKTATSKKLIHDALLHVLDNLPIEVAANCDDKLHFEPELSSEEKSTLKSKRKHLEQLQNYSNKLARYEANLEELKDDTNLWLGNAPTNNVRYFPRYFDTSSNAFLIFRTRFLHQSTSLIHLNDS